MALDVMVARALNTTVLRQASHLQEPLISILTGNPLLMSTIWPPIIPSITILKSGAPTSIFYRLFGAINFMMMNLMLPGSDLIE